MKAKDGGWGIFKTGSSFMCQREDGRRNCQGWRSGRAGRRKVKEVFFLQNTLRGKISMVCGRGKADTESGRW